MDSLVPKNIDTTMEDAKILEMYQKLHPWSKVSSTEEVCEIAENDNKRIYEILEDTDNFNALLTKRFPQRFPVNPSNWTHKKLFDMFEALTKKVQDLTNEVTELRNMIDFAPGGYGYEEAEAEFNGLRSIKS
jgi:hypothetical protein